MSEVQEVLVRLKELAAKRFNKDLKDLQADDNIFETLGLNSLQVLELLTELEEVFGVEIPDYELQDVRTLEDLATCICDRS